MRPAIKGFDELPDASRVLARDGAEVGLLGNEQRDPVTLGQLPEHVSRAVLAAEDAGFYSHSGVDPEAVFRAMVNNARGGSEGGSTITQQLAKLNDVGADRTLFRKFKEVLYASRLEGKYSKDSRQRLAGRSRAGVGPGLAAGCQRPPDGRSGRRLGQPGAGLRRLRRT